jgi:hypothetical protein
MADQTLLYLLRHPGTDLCPLLKAGQSGSPQCSLVLLERAVAVPPDFSGPVYRLQDQTEPPKEHGGGSIISYRELIALIARHDRTIVL